MRSEELARAARVGVEDIERWVGLGLLGDAGAQELGNEALERARLLRLAVARGLRAEDIAAAVGERGDLLRQFVERLDLSDTAPVTLDEAARRSGLDVGLASRLMVAAGLSPEELGEDDVRALEAARLALDAGFPADALLQLMRVLADALARVAEAESRLFHFYVHDRLRLDGMDAAAAEEATTDAADPLLALVEPTVLYFHRKAWRRAMRDDVITHLAEDVVPSGPVGQLPLAVLFVDLARFTALTEAMGDEAAADVLDRFSELVREEALHCDGRVVKQIGDEFMLVFPSAAVAVRYALHLAETASTVAQFPALRMGAHAGLALYREADYLGATVNIAARVAAQAPAGQLVVTRAVRDASDGVVAGWIAMGECRLKGISEPVELFAVAVAAPGAD